LTNKVEIDRLRINIILENLEVGAAYKKPIEIQQKKYYFYKTFNGPSKQKFALKVNELGH